MTDGKKYICWTKINCSWLGSHDWVMHGTAMGSPEGFTIVDFKDLDGDELYSENTLIKQTIY